MKKLLVCLSALAIVACKQEPKDYVTFSGKITDQNSDSLTIIQSGAYSKTIKVNEDGTFSDTLKVKTGVYTIFDGAESSSIYLKNGYDLSMSLDTKEFDETIKFTGTGSENSNYLAEKALYEEEAFAPNLFSLEEVDFETEITLIKKNYKVLLENNTALDSTLLANEVSEIDNFKTEILGYYKKQKEMAKAKEEANAKFIGKPSPVFENYENAKGGTTSLSDLKGKYVYVDVWATWCGPCKREIPYLKEVEKEFHDKNIAFVSLSVDDGRGFKGSVEDAKKGWKKMIAEKELGGVQIIADKGWKSSFITDYQIQGIPRFILIDPSGNIVSPDAPRPSNPKLKELFNSLSI